jgi:RND family efflux transporter MFP subunit
MDMLRQDDYIEGAASLADDRASSAGETKQSRVALIKKIAIPIAILLAGAAVVALINLLEQPADKKENAFTLPGVTTLAVESQAVTFTIASQGTLAPRTETPLVTEVSGVVMTVSPKLQAGGFFKAGEVLLTLDDSDYRAAVKLAEANLLGKKAQLTQEVAQTAQAEKEWSLSGRSKSEAPILALRQPFLEKAKAEVLYAEAELAQAQRKLDRTSIRAPYDGLIKSKNIGAGQYVTVGTSLAEIIAIDYAEVRLPLSDSDVAFINLPSPQDAINIASSETNQGPSVTLTATVGGKVYSWPAKIVRTEGIIDSRSRVHYAVARVNDPYGLRAESNGTLRPALSVGSFVKAQIQGVTVNDVFAVPRNAFRDENTLMVMDADGRLRLRQAEAIRSDNELVYLASGINPGEEVITTAMAAPVDGMQVRKFEQ